MITDKEPPVFAYTPLKAREIRVLRPGNEVNAHDWILESISLDAEDLDYDALSYTWGLQNETYPITCNGRSMRVHHNLYSALPFLARRTGELSTRPIWIDAVCINQKDEDEKRVQIRLMNILYRRAKQVWVWLGCGTHGEQAHIGRAVTLLPHIIDESTRRKSLPKTWRTEEVATPLRSLHPGVWRTVTYLLRNTWYHRVWIVQEAALAAEITFLCGQHRIDYKLLEAAVQSDTLSSWKVTDANGDPVTFSRTRLDSATVFWIRQLVRGESTIASLSIPDLMLRVVILLTGEHACFLPQDRIVGMLGLFDEKELSATGINFTIYLLTHNEPYKRLWWRFFNMAFGLERMIGLPSWVPDFHHQAKETSQLCFLPRIEEYAPKDQHYQASRIPTTVCSGSCVNRLVLPGKILDEVTFLHPLIPKRPDGVQDNGEAYTVWYANMSKWEEEIAEKVIDISSLNIGENFAIETSFRRVSEDTYWQTLLANDYFEEVGSFTITKEACREYRATMRQVRIWCEWKLEQLERVANGFEELPPVIDEAVLQGILPETPACDILTKLLRLEDRQIFNSAAGRFGFVIRGAQPGDLVCVFNSATTPHVLRKVPNEGAGKVYKIIGDTYVSDLMYGESDSTGISVQDIVLV
ncbi:heterokaryon incompatibility protein-domain-containing protein [Ampelomyces quisqualis]|uniref:Heterokaryon incompatibility protein-domain-containing protein n=1 Tax=Ampelomyces quisqualis TaxID=50730 RepID=A0A6A5QPX1_AMPQU|nr:heterokaryon incompatibility protein-domain-containing protein [Ampelomyces quisqualis]